MQPGEIYLLFTEPIEAIGLDYIVTGSVASSSYGEPRFTHDIDLILWLPAVSVENLGRALPLKAQESGTFETFGRCCRSAPRRLISGSWTVG